ncbi:tyrosine--tRNA ligase [Carbonactinospora thermoautotrophica]|uniref:Tyrosine--tRNA ligase n=1 Tax=Carbonactinospora thermoautotrophica TaxID=1469144 RepID=A0A132N5F0_9ACTN|nr:tyrosine--tRNA ligase [Carbonactinospora thermoautotrophica]KWX00811.1 Tyrosine--tRNA ligase [Carbonactinospora thermoautotrophica]KWX05246.1 tyrosyl-tRNA synthetase [Carbonactinospora thermoautotrophica]KWX10299.1 tyrosyl-tRNA synthetase [Carbonactinospora thermoautotrophica]MCX9192922.1 tyrosine--tRNA ligase [Carbonactinospora thermoautotrophica]
MTDILDELHWRGLIAQSTDEEALRAEFAKGPVTVYCGFDPTAPSLHIGNLVQLLTLRRLQRAGHRPIGLVGGATGLIGDPSGRSTERQLNEVEVVEGWVQRIRGQVERFLDFDAGQNAALLVNNLDWTRELTAISFLRDIGKHFSVNSMLSREVVRARLETGISYTEFSYVILQAMDYLELYRRYGCKLQIGGSDQWGNIVSGVDLIRRVTGGSAHALTTPLLTKADGTKFGKTAGGAVWLDPELTTPYAFYQFWINQDDRDVPNLLRVFSFKSREEIEALEKEVAERPAARAAQRALAEEITSLVHGPDECARVVAASRALFGHGALEELDERTLASALAEAPHAELPRDPMPSVVDMLVATGLSPSKSAARRTINEGGAYLNNRKITDEDAVPEPTDLLHGRWLVLRRGKRNMAGVRLG